MKKKISVILAVLMIAAVFSACSDNKTGSAEEKTDYSQAAAILTEVKTTQYFTDEKVPSEDIEKILSAGVNAPSAMNTQPWHFTAVTDKETTDKLADAMKNMKPPARPGKPDETGELAGEKDRPKPSFLADGENPPPPPADGEKKPPEGKPDKMPEPPEGKPGFAKGAKKAGIGSAPLTIVISCEKGSELSAGLAVQNMAVEAQLLGYGTKILTSPTMALNGENKEEFDLLLNIPDNQQVCAVLIVGKEDADAPEAASSATTRNPFEDTVTIIGE